MKVGTLWFCNDPTKTLTQKVQDAAARYLERFEQKANTCYVHPSTEGVPTTIDGIQVKTAGNALQHTFWVGVEAGAK